MTVIGDTWLDLSGADAKSAAEVSQSLERFWHDFPKAAPLLRSVRLGNLPYEACAQTQRTDGDYMPPGRPMRGSGLKIILNDGMYVPHGHFGGRAFIDATRIEGEQIGWWPKGTTSFDHELGHVLDIAVGMQLHEPNDAPYSFHRIIRPDALSVSMYGWEAGPQEVFADAFAAWWVGQPVGNANIQRVVREATQVARGQRELVAA